MGNSFCLLRQNHQTLTQTRLGTKENVLINSQKRRRRVVFITYFLVFRIYRLPREMIYTYTEIQTE